MSALERFAVFSVECDPLGRFTAERTKLRYVCRGIDDGWAYLLAGAENMGDFQCLSLWGWHPGACWTHIETVSSVASPRAIYNVARCLRAVCGDKFEAAFDREPAPFDAYQDYDGVTPSDLEAKS